MEKEIEIIGTFICLRGFDEYDWERDIIINTTKITLIREETTNEELVRIKCSGAFYLVKARVKDLKKALMEISLKQRGY